MVRIYVPNSGRHPYIRYLDHPRDSDLAGETNDSTPKYYTWQRFGGRYKMTRLPIQNITRGKVLAGRMSQYGGRYGTLREDGGRPAARADGKGDTLIPRQRREHVVMHDH